MADETQYPEVVEMRANDAGWRGLLVDVYKGPRYWCVRVPDSVPEWMRPGVEVVDPDGDFRRRRTTGDAVNLKRILILPSGVFGFFLIVPRGDSVYNCSVGHEQPTTEKTQMSATDKQILDAVAAILPDRGSYPDDWTDQIDAALAELGVETRSEYFNDWTVAWLADGRRVVLNDESAEGAARYRIDA